MTLGPLADAARYPDGLEGAGIGHIEIIRIDQLARVLDLAAERDGKAPHRRAETAPRLADIAGQADIAHPVRRLGQLPQEPPRRLEGAMHVPQRTGPAEPRELQAGGGMALGDRAGLIDPDKEERDPLGAGTLQRRQAVADLLDRGPE